MASIGRRAVSAALAVVLLGMIGCSGGRSAGRPDADPAASSPERTALDGTIVMGPGGRLWVASPDDRSVGIVEPDSLAGIGRVELDGTPARLLADHDSVLVSFADRSTVSIVTGGNMPVESTVDVPCAATSALTRWESGGRAHAAVACPVDGRIALVDLYDRRAEGWLETVGQPTALTVEGGDLVAASAKGVISRWPLRGLTSDRTDRAVARGLRRIDDVRRRDRRVWTLPARKVSQLSALAPSPAGGTVATYQVVDSDRASDPTDPADTGSYASVIEGTARIEPALDGWCPHQYTDLRNAAATLAGPASITPDGRHGRLWVVGQQTGNVVVLDCARPARTVDGVRRARILATFDVGVGAAGLTLAPDGRTAWVDSSFDHAVVRLTVGADGTATGTRRAVRELGAMTFSPRAEQGRRIFYDATDVHLTPNRVVTCASCHRGGGDDGLNWRISTRSVARKYRRTPALWQLVPSRDTGDQLHWDGAFDDLDELSSETIHQLLGGDGLLVDTGAIGQWLAELPVPPAPWTDPADAEAGARREDGRTLFEGAAGCASCHGTPSGSDGRRHAGVLPDVPDPDSVMAEVRTPRLVGLAARAPYFHDGRAATLEDVLRDNPDDRHGVTSTLTDEQIAALVAYLASR